MRILAVAFLLQWATIGSSSVASPYLWEDTVAESKWYLVYEYTANNTVCRDDKCGTAYSYRLDLDNCLENWNGELTPAGGGNFSQSCACSKDYNALQPKLHCECGIGKGLGNGLSAVNIIEGHGTIRNGTLAFPFSLTQDGRPQCYNFKAGKYDAKGNPA